MAAAVVGIGWGLSTGAHAASVERPGYRTLLKWESGSGAATGVVFFRAEEDGLARRLLVESPQGRRLVLTKRLLVQEGEDRYELVDEESGWWVRLVKEYDFEVKTLEEFFDRAEELLEPREDNEVEIELLTSKGLHFTATMPVAQQGETETLAFAERLLESEVGAELRDELPEGLDRGIVFLDVAFEPAASDLRALIQVLAELVDPAVREAVDDAHWKLTQERRSFRLTPDTSEEARWVAGFLTVDPTEPLK